MKDIFDKCNLGNLKLNSRIIRTGTWERDNSEGGFLENSVFERYENIAKSGVGAIISEMFALDSKDRFFEYSANLNYKGFIKDYKEITNIAHKYNVPILGQLAFFYYNDGINQKVEANDITIEGIRHLQTDVIITAKKFAFAGFDGLQLNLGNNFYLARFINPYFNQRKDKYGGNTYNRVRIVLEIIKLIKDNFDLHVSCRVNTNDARKGGITTDESIKICKLLEEAGADSIQLTGRTISYNYTEKTTNPFIDYTNKLTSEINIPIILGGNLRSMNQINDILNKTNIDFFSLSKPFVAQPDFLTDWKENGEGTSICQSCNNCYSKKESHCFIHDNI